MKAKIGINKDNVFSTLCQAGFKSIVTGGRSINLLKDDIEVIFKHHKYSVYIGGIQRWVNPDISLQWFKNGKRPKKRK